MIDYLSSLNDPQREAVLCTEGPLIVLAGAGSGKTKMLTSRITHLISAHNVAAHQILAVTFTNKAAQEMRERVERQLGLGTSPGEGGGGGGYGGGSSSGYSYGYGNGGGPSWGRPEIGTFHSVCVRLLRREADKLPFTKPFVIYDDSDQLSLIKQVVEKLGIDSKAFSPKGLQAGINRVKCDALEPSELNPPPHNIFERQLKRVYEEYQKDLVAANALDFGEILCMTYRLLRDNLDVRRKLQGRYRYIHVDEYQDTNRAQYLLLSMLASREFGASGNICVVGDEDQSIYKWRGADIRNILDFESDYPGAKVVKLEQNYRSTKTIITAASHLIRNNKTRKDKTLWTANEEGLPILRAQFADERAEAEMAVSEVKRLCANDGRAYGDFAIFYRTHAQSRQFEDVLRRENIPYQIVGGLRFYDRKEIKDVLAYFRVILNPSDPVSIKRILNVPARGIGKTTIDKIDELCVTTPTQGPIPSFWDALERAAVDGGLTSNATARKIERFVALIKRFTAEQSKIKLSELYHLILDETGYIQALRKEGTEEATARIQNLEEFDTVIQEFEEEMLAMPAGNFVRTPEGINAELLPLFLERATLASDVDSVKSFSSVVNLMTLHSSKGLEFPIVFLVGMEDGLFPSIRPWEEEDEEEMEEERRLCYVGMTRAREQLYLMHVLMRRIWGNVSYQEPARFFNEIPNELMEFKDFSLGAGASQYRIGSSRQFGYQGKQVETRLTVGLVGHGIDHPDYGDGRIVLVEGMGDDQKVVIEFKSRDRKKFLLRYVKQYLEGMA